MYKRQGGGGGGANDDDVGGTDNCGGDAKVDDVVDDVAAVERGSVASADVDDVDDEADEADEIGVVDDEYDTRALVRDRASAPTTGLVEQRINAARTVIIALRFVSFQSTPGANLKSKRRFVGI